MPSRALRMPEDFIPIADLIAGAFRYPENPAWDVQSDEQEEMIATFNRLERYWALIRPLFFLSPTLRDTLQGFIWEEESPAGVVLIQRKGSSNSWEIGDVAVLPAYRRRGIARELIRASLEFIRAREGQIATLEVIEGNLPAQRLYDQLGFEAYGRETLLDRMPPHPQFSAPLPSGFSREILDPFDWRRRYDFEKRVTPTSYQAFEPVEIARFCQPSLMRFLRPLLLRLQGRDVIMHALVHTDSARTEATYRISLPTRGIGPIEINAAIDPIHAGLCEAIASDCVTTASRLELDSRIEWIIPDWMPALSEAAEALGFIRKYEAIRMGRRLE